MAAKPTMIEPPIDELLDKVDSVFTLVVVAAKRARQLVEGAHKLIDDCASDKPVTVSIFEIKNDMLTYIRTKKGSDSIY